VKLLNQQVGLLDFGKDTFTPRVISLPDLGDADPAGRPVQEPCAQAFFQLDHLFADRSAGNTKAPGSGTKALKLHNIREYFHCGQPIHISSPIVNKLETIMS
jgi:hypothetical protein